MIIISNKPGKDSPIKIIVNLTMLVLFLASTSHISFAAGIREKNKVEFLEAVRRGDMNKVVGYVKNDRAYVDFEDGSSTPLMAAAEGGHLDIIKFLLSEGADLNKRNQNTYKRNALHSACNNNRIKIAEFLLDKGIEINVTDSNGNSPLHYAVNSGNIKMVRLLVSKGADVNIRRSIRDIPPIMTAAMSGNLKILKYLESQGAKANVTVRYFGNLMDCAAYGGNIKLIKYLEAKGQKPDYPGKCLESSIRNGNYEVIKYFIDKGFPYDPKTVMDEFRPYEKDTDKIKVTELFLSQGIDINDKDYYGDSLLQRSVLNCEPEFIKYLIEKGADVNARDPKKRSILHKAVFKDKYRIETLKLLLDKGVDVNAKDVFGFTPLDFAGACGDLKTIKFLESRGALNGENKAVNSLHIAAMGQNREVFDYYLDKGGNINAVDSEGNTPLFYALSGGSINTNHKLYSSILLSIQPDQDFISYLISKGAKVDAMDNQGRQLIHMAAENPDEKVLLTLLSSGADINAEDNEGNTPIMSMPGEPYFMELLISCGADINKRNKKGENRLSREIDYHSTTHGGTIPEIKYLLSLGAEPEISDVVLIIKNQSWDLLPVLILNNTRFLMLFILALILLVFFLWLLFRNKKRRMKTELKEAGKK